MCGIAGLIGWERSATEHKLHKMLNALAHRGPDGRRVFFDGMFALGHTRLSIIDTSDRGLQPLFNEDRSRCVIHNGEIYNYVELRDELQRCGHVFSSDSDSEVIIHGYEEWGERCVERFNGMWAFAIWDGPGHRVFLSRDRLGIKPLYVARMDGGLLFASEIKALLAAEPRLNDINYQQVSDYVVHWLTDHSSDTFFKHVRQVLPAQNVVVSTDGEIRESRYWCIDPSARFAGSREDAAEALLDVTRDAVALQLRSDVTLGASLSGGLDSTSVVALARQASPRRLITFSGVFPDEPSYDESAYIDEMIDAYDVEKNFHTPEVDSFLENLDDCMRALDEPVTSLSISTWWQMSEMVSKRVKVLLTGHGGDEVQAGYFHHFRFFFQHLLEQAASPGTLPNELRRESRLAREKTGSNFLPMVLANSQDEKFKALGTRWLRLLRAGRIAEPLPKHTDVLSEDFAKAHDRRPVTSQERLPVLDPMRQFMWRELRASFLPNILRTEDRLSMAFSYESRVPLLDHRIVELAYSLPANFLIHEGRTKSVVRDAMKGVLPERVRLRSGKMGFPTPVAVWLSGAAGHQIEEIMCASDSHLSQFMDRTKLREQFAVHRSGRADFSKRIFIWFLCELWMRQRSQQRIAPSGAQYDARFVEVGKVERT